MSTNTHRFLPLQFFFSLTFYFSSLTAFLNTLTLCLWITNFTSFIVRRPISVLIIEHKHNAPVPVASNSLMTLLISTFIFRWICISVRPVKYSWDLVFRTYVFNLLRILNDLSADAVDTGIVNRTLKIAYKFGWSWYDASMALHNLLAILWRHMQLHQRKAHTRFWCRPI